MTKRPINRVLAIAAHLAGFGYAVSEVPAPFINWGLSRPRPVENRRLLKAVQRLLDEVPVDALVIEDTNTPGSLKRNRTKRFLSAVTNLAKKRRILIRRYPRREFRGTARNRTVMAVEIASKLSEFAPRLPGPRKWYDPESPWVALFDAAALVLTFLRKEIKNQEPTP